MLMLLSLHLAVPTCISNFTATILLTQSDHQSLFLSLSDFMIVSLCFVLFCFAFLFSVVVFGFVLYFAVFY